ncbi:hypothetical protein [Fundidesulfovibrio agrisoli]|uniref:hypothetical protein n=1 Tax=Fundidesulfovibrio agrisoli TaxID=2922717 RepID=UPI001FADB0B2|nr:hypothetical protein [Fundidesulfovibrio agrisoli]
MKLIIPQPRLYYSNGDEDFLFHWLKWIAEGKDAILCDGGVEITLNDPVDDASLRELIGLMARYSLDMKCLKPLRTAQNEHWFADPMAYWHKSVFGS